MQKPLTLKQQYWFDHISTAQRKGQLLSAYAEAHQLNIKALYKWRWTFSKRSIQSEFSNVIDNAAIHLFNFHLLHNQAHELRLIFPLRFQFLLHIFQYS